MRLIASSFVFLVSLSLGLVRSRRQQRPNDPPKKVVIPFDFESKFDNGEYGQTMGDMFWAKLQSPGRIHHPRVDAGCPRLVPAIPDDSRPGHAAGQDEGDCRQGAGRRHRHLGQGRARAGFETDVYDLWINVADFSIDPPG